MRQPYRQHVGLTFFGVEVFGLSLEGENEIILTDLPRKPQVDWGEVRAAPPARIVDAPIVTRSAEDAPPADGGLRIRLGR